MRGTAGTLRLHTLGTIASLLASCTVPGHSRDLCWRPTHSLTPKTRWDPTGVWAAPAEGSSHTGTGSWFNTQLRNWRSPSPSCLARRPPQAPPAPNKEPGRAGGAGLLSKGHFAAAAGDATPVPKWGEWRVPVWSIAPSSPLIAPASPPHRPGSRDGVGFSRPWGFPSSGTAYGLHVALLHTRTNIQPRDSLDIKKSPNYNNLEVPE